MTFSALMATVLAVYETCGYMPRRPLVRTAPDDMWRLRGGGTDTESLTGPYDYIIVGGGTAGLVLADRLTVAKNNVLVLEAGGDGTKDLRIRVPAGLVKVFKSEYDWDFETEPIKGTNRGVYLCRGKLLGGSSSTNVMLYQRGTPADYDSWVAKGAVGWGPAEVLDYFRKAEHNVDGASQYHGVDGPVDVDYVPYVNKLSDAFLEAAGTLGYRRNNDFNDWSAPQDGFGRFKVTQTSGERCSAANAYLHKTGAIHRPNLHLQTGVHVTRVRLEGSENDLCASGVEYIANDGSTACAQLAPGGEVLLAAGAVQSPQLLMLSGIGPRDHLKELGIDVLKHLVGVGEGLQDHPAVLVSCGCKQPISVTSEIQWLGTGLKNPWTVLQWLLFKKGALTSVSCEFGGFFRTSKERQQPDLQVRFVAARALSADGISTLEDLGAGKAFPPGFTTQIIAIRPHSTGRVRLRSADPLAKPLLEDLHLSDERDVVTLRDGIKLGRRLLNAETFNPYRTDEIFPGKAIATDDEIEEYVRQTVHSANALIGSCRMGADDDAAAVLDPELRVRGVGSLRVVDASAMPHIVGGQTCAPVIMMAEKAADMVLRQRAALRSYSQQAAQAAYAQEAQAHAAAQPAASAAAA